MLPLISLTFPPKKGKPKNFAQKYLFILIKVFEAKRVSQKTLLKNAYLFLSKFLRLQRTFLGIFFAVSHTADPKPIINTQTHIAPRVSYKKIPTPYEKHPFYKASICFLPKRRKHILFYEI